MFDHSEATRDIGDWLVRAALEGVGQKGLLAGLCERLSGAGVALSRVNIAQPTLHPIIDGYLFIWTRESGEVVEDGWLRARDVPAEGIDSVPFAYLSTRDVTEIREPLHAMAEPSRFVIVNRFREEGATDYLALQQRLGATAGIAPASRLMSSWTTDRPGGFQDTDVALIKALFPLFTLALIRAATRTAFESVVTAYLGRAASARIMAGTVQRGEGETLRAALWLCDLRGFTKISESEPRDQLIAMLHDYFGAMADIVHAHGGDILKFTGDGFLATFVDHGSDHDNSCAALEAARETVAALEALRRERLAAEAPAPGIGLGLHLGEVAFGNVGARERLDFTVVGAAVNEVARIEAMSRALDQEVVISAALADAVGRHDNRLLALGRYALRGVRQPQELFTLEPPEFALETVGNAAAREADAD